MVGTGFPILPTEAAAREKSPRRQINIASGTLRRAVEELSREAHVSIGTEGSLPATRTPAVRGRMTVDQALARLLAGTGYAARRVGQTAWRIERAVRSKPAPAAVARPSARAAPPPPSPPIVVTAAKMSGDYMTLPAAVALLDLSTEDQLLPDAGSDSVAASLEGVSLTGSGAGRNRMFLRGVADSPFNGESQSTVAVMLDSARVTYSAPDPDLRLVDVEGVEVLKGPQGSLYGVGTLGGIYKVRTRRPQMGETSLVASGGIESVAHGGLGFGGAVVGNLPVADEGVALRMVGYGMQEAGWIDTGSRTNSNRLAISGARAALAIEPENGWQFDVMGMTQRINSDDSQYVYRAGSYTRAEQLAEPHDNDITLVSARAEGALGSLNLTAETSYVWHEVRDTFDATLGAENFGVIDPQLLHDNREYRVWNSELRLQGAFGQFDWLIGASRLEARQAVIAALATQTDPEAAILDDDRRKSSESAVFGNVRFPLLDDIHAEAGMRLFAGIVKDTRQVAGTAVTRDLHRTGVTPSFALSWQPSERRIVFLRYGSALRQGGVDIGPNGELEAFNSDELATLELGWREHLPGGGHLELGAFGTIWQHVQSDMLLPNGLIETMNVGDARVFGAEASFKKDLTHEWQLELGGTVVNGHLYRDESGLELQDRHLPVVPQFTLRGELTRLFALGRADGSIALRLNYAGPARLSFDPVLDRKMGDRLTGRLTARLALDGLQLAMEVNNLFARRDDTFSLGNRLRIINAQQYTTARPTSVSLSIGNAF